MCSGVVFFSGLLSARGIYRSSQERRINRRSRMKGWELELVPGLAFKVRRSLGE